MSMQIRQPPVTTAVVAGELLVIDAVEVQDGGVKVVAGGDVL